uniref:Ubiquitin-like 3b n=1 Tax=Scophthalmus maximus TaxID=52904 RepID=A0A8D3BYL5_SCOMX
MCGGGARQWRRLTVCLLFVPGLWPRLQQLNHTSPDLSAPRPRPSSDLSHDHPEGARYGWEEERVSSPSILRLIFQGRFLHGNVTLGALKLPPGRTTVMHLVARETLPEPNSHGQRNREKTTESNCCLLL